jgi:alpha-L-fucosidase 2
MDSRSARGPSGLGRLLIAIPLLCLDDPDRPNNRHRHMSPLWGLYPGRDITPADPVAFEAAKLLLAWRGDGSTGWSYAWRIPLWARVADGDFAYRQLELQLARRTRPRGSRGR